MIENDRLCCMKVGTMIIASDKLSSTTFGQNTCFDDHNQFTKEFWVWGLKIFFLLLIIRSSSNFFHSRSKQALPFNLTFLGFSKEIRIHTHFYECFHGGCFSASYLKCSSNPGSQIYNIFSTTLGIPIGTKELVNQQKK